MGTCKKDAPGRLEVVRQFINTVDTEGPETDAFRSLDAANHWLQEHELAAITTDNDRSRLISHREALRDFIEGKGGLPEVASLPFIIGIDNGQLRLQPVGTGAERVIGELTVIMYDAMQKGIWDRFKICEWDSCRWASYDNTKNRSSRWCDPETCGTRSKVKAYRERHKAG